MSVGGVSVVVYLGCFVWNCRQIKGQISIPQSYIHVSLNSNSPSARLRMRYRDNFFVITSMVKMGDLLMGNSETNDARWVVVYVIWSSEKRCLFFWQLIDTFVLNNICLTNGDLDIWHKLAVNGIKWQKLICSAPDANSLCLRGRT